DPGLDEEIRAVGGEHRPADAPLDRCAQKYAIAATDKFALSILSGHDDRHPRLVVQFGVEQVREARAADSFERCLLCCCHWTISSRFQIVMGVRRCYKGTDAWAR